MRIAGRLAAAVAALLCAAPPQPACAQAWPTKPVKLMVAFAAGGPVDLVAREVGMRLASEIGKPVTVENQGGAGGKIALINVARAEPDGHTLLFGASGNVIIHPLVDKDMSVVDQLAPVSLVSSSAHVLTVNPRLLVHTVKELIDYAKANPGKLHFGSAGTGAAAHLGMEMLKLLAGIDIVHVPYRGTSQAVVDVVSGQIEATFSSMPSLKGMIDQGSLRPLGMTAPNRSDSGLPLISDTVPGFGYTVWYGVFAPLKTPRPVIEQINLAVRKVVTDKALQQKLAVQGLEMVSSTPDELVAFMQQDRDRWAKVITAANVSLK